MSEFPLATMLDWTHAVGWTLLHFVWQGAVIGIAYAIVRAASGTARSQVRYASGLCALALMALAPALTLWQLAPGAGAGAGAANAAAAVTGASIAAVFGDLGGNVTRLEPWLPTLVGVWLAGVCLASLRACRQYWLLRNLVRREAEPLREWEPLLRELAQRFGVSRPVRLVRSAIVQTPSLIGWIAPVIVLPTAVLVGLTPRQIELVIAHELGHVRRWDYAVNLLQIALESVLFYHPVVHWISRDVRHEREACCDDLVLRLGADPVDYAHTLASLEELRGVTHAPAVAASGGFLLGRIRRIVGASSAEPAFSAPLSGGQGFLLVTLALAAAMAIKPVARDVYARVTGAAATDSAASIDVTASGAVAESAAALLARVASGALPASPSARPLVEAVPAMAAPVVVAEPEAQVAEIATVRIATPSVPAAAPAVPALARPASAIDLSFQPPSLPRMVVVSPRPGARATVAPAYPRRAALAGVEGHVTLSFSVDRGGRAKEIRVVSATEPGWFEVSSIVALRAWRFDPGKVGERYSQTFDFALTLDAIPDEQQQTCDASLGTRICRRIPAGVEGDFSTSKVETIVDPRNMLLATATRGNRQR
jgi:TonB family protein